jgi:hypothetical protein
MKQQKVRWAQPEDSAQILEWVHANEKVNLFNADILKYPTLRVFCSYDENGPINYLPFQRVFMLESAAPRPGATAAELAQSFRDLTKAAELTASGEGIREIYFLDGGGGLGEMATHHDYELLPYKVYRMRLK